MLLTRFTGLKALADFLNQHPEERYVALLLSDKEIDITSDSLRRMSDLAAASGAYLLFSNYDEILEDGSLEHHPVITYQLGSVRDDFDFGPLVVINSEIAAKGCSILIERDSNMDGGWYALRLYIALQGIDRIVNVPEFLYRVRRIDHRKSGEKQHDYVNPARRDYQIEREKDFLHYLKQLNAEVGERKSISLDESITAGVMASIVIPVRNRVRTILDAVNSALSQKTDFDYNVIVVDNQSTDGTSEALSTINDSRLIVIAVPENENLGIGGCWNKAIESEHCGRFAVQLDSDDLYSSPDTLSTIINKFYEEGCAMVVGSYTLTDFSLNPIGPGLIDHREWTDENGPDNALRINGFGAPRAFFTPVACKFLFPDVSYGEDYAICLAVSGEYKVGRIYDSLYCCRRWEGNSDADLSVGQVNAHNFYKDFVRSMEMRRRISRNHK